MADLVDLDAVHALANSLLAEPDATLLAARRPYLHAFLCFVAFCSVGIFLMLTLTTPSGACKLGFKSRVWAALHALTCISLVYSLHLMVYGVLFYGLLFHYSFGLACWFVFICVRPFLPMLLVIAINGGYLYLLARAIADEHHELAAWLALTLLYGLTYFSDAPRTGSRRWGWMRDCRSLWDGCARYMDFRILTRPALDPQATYMYGFHPHGIYPFTACWAPLTTAWSNAFPGVEMDVCGASVLLAIPFLRDVGMWSGGRDVTREAIAHALSTGRSITIVPGGQAEMRLSRSSEHCGHTDVSLVTKHQGFVRLAMQHGTPLVPIFSFGEHEIFDNVYYPSMQNWFKARIGFGYPHFPCACVRACVCVRVRT